MEERRTKQIKKSGRLANKQTNKQTIDKYLMFHAQSTVKGHIRAKQKCIPTTSINSDSLLNTHSTVEDLDFFGGENEAE